MAFVTIEPTSLQAEQVLAVEISGIQALLRQTIKEVWKIPDSDIIIIASRCNILSPDPDAQRLGVMPDYLIRVETDDQQLLDSRAEKLKAEIKIAWEKWVGHRGKYELSFYSIVNWGTNIEIPEQ